MGKWIKALLVLNVLVFGSIGGIWYWGSTLESPYHAELNRYSQGTPSQIWAWLTDPDSLSKYHPEVTRIQVIDTNWYSQRWSQQHSQLGPMEMQVIKAAIPQHLVIEFIAPQSGLKGLRSVQLIPQLEGHKITGTQIKVFESGTWSHPLRRWWEQWVRTPDTYASLWLSHLSKKKHF